MRRVRSECSESWSVGQPRQRWSGPGPSHRTTHHFTLHLLRLVKLRDEYDVYSEEDKINSFLIPKSVIKEPNGNGIK